jgi:hypothetical protein
MFMVEYFGRHTCFACYTMLLRGLYYKKIQLHKWLLKEKKVCKKQLE